MIRIALAFTVRASRWAACALALAAPLAWSQEAAVTKRATELRQSPDAAAAVLASLPAQTQVTRLAERNLPWVQVRTAAGATGWVHMFDVAPVTGGAARIDPAGGGSSANPLRSLGGLFGGGNTTTGTAASGIRGLDAEDLKNASPDPAAVTRMESMRQSETEARAFARGAPLQAVAVEPLPAPVRATSSGGGDPSRPQN
jgi:hypothetical protein